MNKRTSYFTLLLVLLFILIAINYKSLNGFAEKTFINYEEGVVERVVDGDTLIINNQSVRLLGINTPERGEKYYAEAKKFLEEQTLNKTVKIYFGKDKYDLYNRMLGYIYLEGENINELIVKQGYANIYFPSGKDSYYSSFYSAWTECLSKNINLCEKSQHKCVFCIETELKVDEQLVILANNCDFSCDLTDWTIKDEGRKKYTFEKTILQSNEVINIYSKDFNQKYVWTKAGDSVFIRDSEDKLVLWISY